MQLADCEALIFDSDGVLVDSEVIYLSVERELLAEIGLSYDYETYLSRFVGLSSKDYLSAVRSDFREKFATPFPDDFLEQLNARAVPRIEAELQPIAGVEKVLNAFGKPAAVASSAALEALHKKLTLTGRASLFDPHIYSAQLVTKGKPEPDLFLYAAEQLGVAPENCAVIEDSINGVRAARAAGMLAIGFVGGGHADAGLGERLKAHGAHWVASSHEEIAHRF